MSLEYKKSCKVCLTIFVSKSSRALMCSDLCKKEQLRRNNVNKYRRDNTPVDKNDSVTCHICNVAFKSLSGHLTRAHNISVKDYKKLYSIESIVSDNYSNALSDKFSGEKNPGYNHGGALSPWSVKSTKHNIEEQATAKQKAKDNRTPDKRPICKEYWIAKGFTEEESIKKVSERQTTFSLDICIEKYGEIDGLQVWKDRQNKWKKSYPNTNYSMISQKLFWELLSHINYSRDDIFFAEFDAGNKSHKNMEYVLELSARTIKPDFFVLSKKKIIEFDGDYWHGEKRGNKQREIDRDQSILCSEYSVLHVLEKDYKANPEKVIRECMEFINE